MLRIKYFEVRVNHHGARYWATVEAVSGRQAIAIARIQGLTPYGVRLVK